MVVTQAPTKLCVLVSPRLLAESIEAIVTGIDPVRRPSVIVGDTEGLVVLHDDSATPVASIGDLIALLGCP
jgi:hypothetical protein